VVETKSLYNAAEPVQAEEPDNPLAWKKPDWTKKKLLKKTEKGDLVKSGAYISAPVTNIKEVAETKKDLSFEKPDWTTNTKLRSTDKGEKLKKGDYISRPIGGIKPVEDE